MSGDFKVTGINDTGSSVMFGADDLDKINRILNGENLSLNITIDNEWKFKHNKLVIMDFSGNNKIRFGTSEETAEWSILIPILGGNRELTFIDLEQTLENKTLDFDEESETKNIATNIPDSAIVGIHYDKVTDKPSTFPPATHNHDGSYSALGHNHDTDYSDISHDHDTNYAPLSHNHDATYAALSHNHSAANITSGTLAVARGGTNKSSITEHALLKGGAGNSYSEIAVGTEGYILTVVDGTPAWAEAPEGGTGTGDGSLNTVTNIGDGEGEVFKEIDDDDIQLRTIKAGTGVTVTNNSDHILIDATGEGGGEVNTGSNFGTSGVGIFKDKNSADLRFYKIHSENNLLTVALNGTDHIDLTVNEENINIANLAGTLDWDDIGSKPSTFPPATHNHDSTYAAISHNHAAGDINSGTLAVARGGTGKSSITTHALLKGNGSSAPNEITVGSDNQVLAVVSGTPAWKTLDNEKLGFSQANGGGTSYEITHGMGAEPTYAYIDCMSHSTGRTWTKDGTKITITFDSTLSGGTNAVKIMWRAVA